MKFPIFLLAVFLSISARAQLLSYHITFPNAAQHEAEVTLTISKAPTGPLIARMSRSSPGRYATHEFGKNVYNVSATNKSGEKLNIEQIEGDVYRIAKHDGNLTISYTIFGNHVDGTYLAIDEAHAHMNMPATFMWIKGLEKSPIQITFHDLNKYNWKASTQLFETKDPATFTAPNLQYFMDSPTELSAFKTASWTATGSGTEQPKFFVDVHSFDTQATVDEFGGYVRKIVDEAKEVFGEFPKYDNGAYHFIYDLNPANHGDGMEHRNSTIITSSRAGKIDTLGKTMLSTFAHEFVHGWNVERIRPKSLEPFNFEHANMSNELWFAEGFTQYYGTLLLKRAGFLTEAEYLRSVGGTINSILNSPGAGKFSPTQMSRYAVFVDAGVAVDQTNYQNIFASYYTYGEFTALALDLRLRSEFNKTLDDYMQAVWKAHGKPEIPYTIADLQRVLSTLTNSTFASSFFNEYVYGAAKNDYRKLLSFAGLDLRKSSQGKASLGPLRTTVADDRVVLSSSPIAGTTIYEAGLSEGDYILQLNSKKIKESTDIRKVVEALKPGENISITYEHRGVEKTSTVTLKENPALEVVLATVQSDKQRDFRNAWLTSKVK